MLRGNLERSSTYVFSTNGPSPPGDEAPSCCTPVLTTRGDGGGSGASGHGGGADLRCVRGAVRRGGGVGTPAGAAEARGARAGTRGAT